MTSSVLSSSDIRADYGFPFRMFKGHVFAMLTMCFDGSGKEDDLSARFVTLAGFAAEQDAWDFFNAEWANTLDRFRRKARYMHMIEAIPRSDEFEGWSKDDVMLLLTSLAVIPSMVASARLPFTGIRFTIDASAYRQYAHSNAIGIPANLAIGSFLRLFTWYSNSPKVILEPVAVLFDRGEPYLNAMMQRWNRRKAVRGKKVLWDMISSIAPVDMKLIPGVQLADMLAWSTNRVRTKGTDDWPGQVAKRILDLMPHLWNEVEEVHMRDVKLSGELFGLIVAD